MLRNTGVRESNSQVRIGLRLVGNEFQKDETESICDCDRVRFKLEKLN